MILDFGWPQGASTAELQPFIINKALESPTAELQPFIINKALESPTAVAAPTIDKDW